jgi:hypothetical protein
MSPRKYCSVDTPYYEVTVLVNDQIRTIVGPDNKHIKVHLRSYIIEGVKWVSLPWW